VHYYLSNSTHDWFLRCLGRTVNYELLIEKGADDLLMMTGYSTIMKIKDLKKRLKL
jgi:hypothetical protein